MYYYAKSGLNCLLIKGKVVPLHADYYQRSLNRAPWCVDRVPIGLGSSP